jgi:hypothetical protein
VKVELLDQKHPSYDADLWRKYDALYRGGAAFRRCIEDFLPRNEEELHGRYECRKREAPFRSYVGPIVDFFAAKLFGAALSIRATSHETGKAIEPDPFYESFKEDCDRRGTDLVDFARSRLTQALVKGRAWFVASLPSDDGPEPVSRADWEMRRLGDAQLGELDNEQVFDWEADDSGALLWAVVHCQEMRRTLPTDSRTRITERWQVYDRATVSTYEISYDPAKEQRPQVASQVGQRKHGFDRVPLVCMGFVGTRGLRTKIRGTLTALSPSAVEGLWLTNRIADSQVEHFRLAAAMSWNLKQTCYAMPVFHILSDEHMPVMGAGLGIVMGLEEKAAWLAPPTGHLDVLQQQLKDVREELYRIANQMAQGIDNNAAAIGRSGESKQVDADAAEVCLRVYGAIAKEAIEQAYDLIRSARGENDVCWSIEGLDQFNLGDLSTVVKAAAEVTVLNIPSPTLRKEMFRRVAGLMVPHAEQGTRAQIDAEINKGVDEQVAAEHEHTEAAEDEDDDAEEDSSDPDGVDEEREDDDRGKATSRDDDAGERSPKAA